MTESIAEPALSPATNPSDRISAGWTEHARWAFSLFLFGIGAKFWLIHRWGSPLPYLDQWPGEAINLFVPFLQHRLSPGSFFEPHNEHRILFTRLCDICLLLLNNQWDARLEMVFNACVHSAAVAGFGWVAASMMGRRSWPLIWCVLALDLALPFAWENTLWGFQSQFYFLLLFSVLSIWLLGSAEPLSRRWWLGVIALLASLFTMASGFLAAVAAGAMSLLFWLKNRERPRHLITFAVCVVIAVAGLCLKPNIPEHKIFQAHSPADFLTSLGKNLAWPWVLLPLYAPVNLFPAVALAWMSLRSHSEPSPAERLLLGVGLWVALQCLAVAYSRGAGGANPAWRYMDVFSFLAIVDALAIVLLLRDHRHRLACRPLWHAGFAVWALGCLSGLLFLGNLCLKQYIPEFAVDQADQLKSSRAFIATGDVAALQHKSPNARIVPNVDAVVWLLRHPALHGIFPACLREPLQVAGTNTNTAFVPNGWHLDRPDPASEISWGSYTGTGAATRGRFESQPIQPASLPFLEIPVAGDLGQSGLSLELVELSTGRAIPVQPAQTPGGKWINACAKSPSGAFKIVAEDNSDAGWFAFKAPREMGRLSYWALRISGAWECFVLAGGGLLALNLILLFAARPRGVEAN